MSTLSDNQVLDIASEVETARLKAKTPLQALPWPRQVFALVWWAQCDLDCYGLTSFFEEDYYYLGNPSYSLFAGAYRAIGEEETAYCIEAVAAMFPFPDPHLDREARLAYLRGHYADTTGPLEARLFGVVSEAGDDQAEEVRDRSEEVYALLAAYARDQGLVSVTA